MFEDYPDVLTVDDLCSMLRICKRTAYALIKDGTIEHFKIRRKIYTTKANVIKLFSHNELFEHQAQNCYNDEVERPLQALAERSKK